MKQSSVLFFILFLSSCATLSESACKKGNWKEIGNKDGVKGERLSVVDEHAKACSDYGVTVNKDLYTEGYKNGLKTYCKVDRAFDLGYSGESYNYVCKDKKFEAEFNLGHKIYSLKNELENLEREIQRLKNDLEESNTASYVKSKEALRKEMTGLQKRHSNLKKKLISLAVKSGKDLEDLVNAI